jgi:hypothetical protein
MTDIERAAFEEWMKGYFTNWAEGLRRSGDSYINVAVDAAWDAWQARASRPVVVTDEMVEAAAKVANSFQFPNVGWSDLREPYKQRLIGRVRQVLSAALNGGT